MADSFQLFPTPSVLSTQTDDPQRTCHSVGDPNRNALALAVVPASIPPPSQNNITSVPDQSLCLLNAPNFNLARRSFLTRSYEIFSSLQKVVQLAQDDQPIFDSPPPSHTTRIPCADQLKYHHRIGNQYVVALKDYLAELEADEENNGDEIDLVLQMIEAFSLFVLVHLPADGRGDGVVAEQIMDWVNRTNPQPPKEEGEELTRIAIPYQHVNFWPYIHACVIRGHLAQATALLKSYTKTHNPTLNQLMTVTISLLTSAPRSTSFVEELDFSRAVDRFRDAVERALLALETEMNVVLENETARAQSGAGAFDEDDLLHFQASYKILLEILAGDQERVSEACYDWREALGAYLLWVDPLCKRDNLPLVMTNVTKEWPIDETSRLDRLSASILMGDLDQTVDEAGQMDCWLGCHLVDLVFKLGIPLPAHARPFHIHSFVDYLSVDQGLWRLMVGYLATVEGSQEFIRAILRRLVVEDLGDHAEDSMDVDPKPAKATTQVSMLELKLIYREHGLEDEMNRTARIMSQKLMKQRKYGTAIAYASTANDLQMLSRISDCLLEEYLTNGPEEFARLVDEVPGSLLHPTAPALRPGLFFGPPVEAGGTEVGEEDSEMGWGAQAKGRSSKLVFLSRYRDMHSYYARGERRRAAETLVGLLTGEVAPRAWWAVCLIDLIPLLEDDEMLVSLADTYELMRCLEEVVAPIIASGRDAYDQLRYLKRIVREGKRIGGEGQGKEDGTRAAVEQLEVVRYALGRHLARCLVSGH